MGISQAADILNSNCDVLIASGSVESLLSYAGLKSFGDLSFKTVLIGMDTDEEQFLSAVRAGVAAYLLKDASAAEVVGAVRAVSRGEAVCPAQLSSALFRCVAKLRTEGQSGAGAKAHLTARQQQLAALAAKGLTDKEIASQLNLSSYTVRNHILRMVKQLNARNRDEAVETIRGSGHAVTAQAYPSLRISPCPS